jgi:hypothetical protein
VRESRKSRLSRARCVAITVAGSVLASCGGSDSHLGPGSGPPPYSAVPQVKVSQPTSFPAGCDGVPPDGILYPDTAIEPQIAANLLNNSFLIASWQQNRWSSGGSQTIAVSISSDGGNTWVPANAPFFSRCAGGNSSNAGNYARASNAWVSIAPNGVAYALALAFTGDALAPASSSAMLVSQSIDGGANWTLPIALIQDGAAFFNDKGSITADPTNSNYVYAVWDRLNAQANTGPSFFSLTANASSTWSTARSIYDPGVDNQTINNIIVVTPDDTLVNLFNEIDGVSGGMSTAHLKVMLSSDNGTTWTPPVLAADMLGVGTVDPNNSNGVRDSVLLFTTAVGPDGVIYVAWQDARFSSGSYDGIALSHSADHGLTWSTPVQVNGDTSVPAFTPALAVSPSGTIAVTYYDLRNAHYSKTQLLTDAWIVTSSDGIHFTESHLSGPFDLQLAPLTPEGYFLGDYQGLVYSGTQFEPFYAQTDSGTAIAADVYFSSPSLMAGAQAMNVFTGQPALGTAALPTAARMRASQRIRAALAHRYPDTRR